MPTRAEQLSLKVDRLSEMIDRFERQIENSNSVMNLPKAEGPIGNCQKQMLSMLGQLKEAGVEFWLDGHSLLAACRTKYLLPWETSMDIGMMQDRWMELQNSGLLEELGMKVEKGALTSIEEPKFGALKPNINVWTWEAVGNAMLHDEIEVDFKVVWPLIEMALHDASFPAPNHTWNMMKAEFGECWMQSV